MTGPRYFHFQDQRHVREFSERDSGRRTAAAWRRFPLCRAAQRSEQKAGRLVDGRARRAAGDAGSMAGHCAAGRGRCAGNCRHLDHGSGCGLDPVPDRRDANVPQFLGPSRTGSRVPHQWRRQQCCFGWWVPGADRAGHIGGRAAAAVQPKARRDLFRFAMRFGFFDFTHVFIPKPVPTFGRHALGREP
ncbi:hypothetical protein MPL1032_110042 [Mesorhizobium plurifarium]|uniref:Uncharacterized protein n=1 Tax=Mesorhizobium plurifarium TaxID=69974 RepID=A0A0K2VPX6_MESPL|nr:hypothetical protein MPL1032_110042 [Mesorhizobium plurifarium]